jgi:hypothetical protein
MWKMRTSLRTKGDTITIADRRPSGDLRRHLRRRYTGLFKTGSVNLPVWQDHFAPLTFALPDRWAAAPSRRGPDRPGPVRGRSGPVRTRPDRASGPDLRTAPDRSGPVQAPDRSGPVPRTGPDRPRTGPRRTVPAGTVPTGPDQSDPSGPARSGQERSGPGRSRPENGPCGPTGADQSDQNQSGSPQSKAVHYLVNGRSHTRPESPESLRSAVHQSHQTW